MYFRNFRKRSFISIFPSTSGSSMKEVEQLILYLSFHQSALGRFKLPSLVLCDNWYARALNLSLYCIGLFQCFSIIHAMLRTPVPIWQVR